MMGAAAYMKSVGELMKKCPLYERRNIMFKSRWFKGLVLSVMVGVFFMPYATCFGASSSDKIVMRFSDWGPPRLNNAFDRWFMDELQKRTAGRVKIDTFFSESLVKGKTQLESMGAGVFDFGPFAPPYTPGKTPLSNVISLPFVTSNVAKFASAQIEVNKLPEIRRELEKEKVKFLYSGVLSDYHLLSKVPVRRIEDLKGLRLRCYGYQEQAYHAVGVTPITMAPPEVFDALQKGTIDGIFYPLDSFISYGLADVAKYATLISTGVSGRVGAISMRTWDKLPGDIKAVIEELTAQAPKKWEEFVSVNERESLEKFKAKGGQVFPWPKEERVKLLKVGAEPIWNAWIKEMEGRGLAGKKVFDAYYRAAQ